MLLDSFLDYVLPTVSGDKWNGSNDVNDVTKYKYDVTNDDLCSCDYVWQSGQHLSSDQQVLL